MTPRISFLLAATMLPLSAQSSLDDGGRMLPPNQQTVQPAQSPGATAMHPGVTAPPPGVPIPADPRPAAPKAHCYLKEFTVVPSVFREGMLYKDELKTVLVLNVPAPHRMVFHVISNNPGIVTCTDVVVIKNSLTSYGGIKIMPDAIHHDTKFEFKAYSVEDPNTILHSRLYVKPKLD